MEGQVESQVAEVGVWWCVEPPSPPLPAHLPTFAMLLTRPSKASCGANGTPLFISVHFSPSAP